MTQITTTIDCFATNKAIAELLEFKHMITGNKVFLREDLPDFQLHDMEEFDIFHESPGITLLSMFLIGKFDILRDYEPYDCLGYHWGALEAKNPIKTLEYDYSRNPSVIKPSVAVCLAVLESVK